ncbi:Superoxide dismutase [Mn] 1, mitochondrial [Zancudomyces culisetae]|uniref:Superoxide dismutase n=1 Tax=Zancudomyces culisetae TaxID=1213189 RepID=A0A1R1PW32_ZANCU|nr:Superoxide dismutase [Mn] 1, mitochondrial [Zancudomyces culisetae]|eukprot:OMH85180.1 Superoxide dismutase [Mn] 1, mitochondrial [Zancudomyces culisetae]
MIGKSALRTLVNNGAKIGVRFGGARFKHTLPELAYGYDELEPVLSKKLMMLHHDKHHRAYVTNLNNSIEQMKTLLDSSAALTGKQEGVSGDKNKLESLRNEILANDKKLAELQRIVGFNAGGHINHSLMWDTIKPTKNGGGDEGNEISASLSKQISRDFGGIDNLKKLLVGKSMGLMGSGWGWLVFDYNNKSLGVMTTANQDTVGAAGNYEALFGIDAWEHAYYVDYNNVKLDFYQNIWKIVNWKKISETYEKAMSK